MRRRFGFVLTAALFALAGNAMAASSYLYVEDNNSLLSAFEIGTTGALKEIAGSPFASNTTGPGYFSVTVDPKGPYLYATGSQSENVAIFSIGKDGALKSVSDTTDAGTGATAMVLTSSGKRLYLVNTDNGGAVAAFDVRKKGAKLSAVAGSPFPVTCPGFCTSSPSQAIVDGAYLYTIDTDGWYVSSFSAAKNGALTELNSYATDYGPIAGVTNAKGTYLYVVNGAHADVGAYSVADGALTQLAGSPFPAGNSPLGIAMSPNDKFVYVANAGDGTISGYSIGNGGALDALSGSPFADGSNTSPTALAIDKAGQHLFVTNSGTETVAVYDIAKSGGLTAIKGSPFAISEGTGPKGLAIYEAK